MAVKDWSTTASANATADSANGIVWSEGQAPSSINDSARAMMAVIKGDFDKLHGGQGYQKFPNGLIVQWETFSVGVPNTFGTWTYPIPFPTSGGNTVVLHSPISGTASADVRVWHNSPSGTSVQIAANAATFMHVVAIGW